jgi:transposase-like protein
VTERTLTDDRTAAQAAQMREQGASIAECARRFGVSTSTIRRWLDPALAERTRRSARELKRTKYTGTCVDCGAKTAYSGNRSLPSERCADCSHEKQSRETRVWTAEAVIAAIQAWTAEHGRPPRSNEWIRSEDGHPASSLCYRHSGAPNAPFVAWNDAVRAAGFDPADRRRYERVGLAGASEQMRDGYALVAEHGPITATELARLQGRARHAAFRSLTFLQRRGFVVSRTRRTGKPGAQPLEWEIAA